MCGLDCLKSATTHFVLVWFLGLKSIQSRSESYFARKVSLHQATKVLVEKELMDAVAIANMGSLVELVRTLETKLRKWLK